MRSEQEEELSHRQETNTSGAGPWQRVSLAFSLDQYPGPWSDEQFEQAQRLVRDVHRNVWDAACQAVGRRAHGEVAAAQLLGELLTSPVMEMRLRGLVALGALAPNRPEEVLSFLEQRLEEAAWHPDPVLLEGILALLPQVPEGRGIDLMAAALEDDRDAVRAAAAGALIHFQSWPWASLVRLVTDPSIIVRASLVHVLARFVPQDEAVQALALLAAAPEAPLRELVARELPRNRPEVQFLLGSLAADSEPRVREAALTDNPAGEPLPRPEPVLGELLLEPHPGLVAATALEAKLDANPDQALETLRPLLAKPGMLATLALLGEMARNISNRLLCRALHALFSSRTEEPARRLLRMLGILTEETGDGPGGQLKRLVWLAIQAFDADSLDKIIVWGRRIERGEAEGLNPSAYRLLAQLGRVARNLDEGFGMVALAQAGSDLQSLSTELAHLTDPEREILQMVLDRWREFFSEGMHELLVGATTW
ncbi:MAG: hypothetical protein AMXMBFR33_67550 [Candidatus Xenobia bacterium]